MAKLHCRSREWLSDWRARAGIIAISIAVGCGRSLKNDGPTHSNEVPISSKGLNSLEITVEEAHAFVDTFLDGCVRADFEMVNSVFDWETFSDRSLDGIEASNEVIANLKSTLVKRLQSNNSLITKVRQQVEEGGSYRFVRIHDMEGQRRSLFRLLPRTRE